MLRQPFKKSTKNKTPRKSTIYLVGKESIRLVEIDGNAEGMAVGTKEGDTEGVILGSFEGMNVGSLEGLSMGDVGGRKVGEELGAFVRRLVGGTLGCETS
jgi:hypothetical protein